MAVFLFREVFKMLLSWEYSRSGYTKALENLRAERYIDYMEVVMIIVENKSLEGMSFIDLFANHALP